jgi:succinate dehydrogenase / fumarate reductase cytochrome b subunit
MNSRGRPLSPHLSIYRWPVTMTLSILHRASGVALSLGFILLTVWLHSAAEGGETHERLAALLRSIGGRVVLVGLSFAFFYHLTNGVRHLIWDLGYGFEIRQANTSSWVVILSTLALTLLYWLVL